MTSETVVSGVRVEARAAIGARVEEYAGRLPEPGHVEAAVVWRGNRWVVEEAMAYPNTAKDYDISAGLAEFLNR
jgi:hypothetical protein